MTTAEVLENAADLIDQKGWIQGSDFNTRGYCARGAIMQVVMGEQFASMFNYSVPAEARGPMDALSRHLRLGNWDSLPGWNDHLPRKTGKQTVTKAMRECAAKLTKQPPMPRVRTSVLVGTLAASSSLLLLLGLLA